MQYNNQDLEAIMDLKQLNIFLGKTSYIVHKKEQKMEETWLFLR